MEVNVETEELPEDSEAVNATEEVDNSYTNVTDDSVTVIVEAPQAPEPEPEPVSYASVDHSHEAYEARIAELEAEVAALRESGATTEPDTTPETEVKAFERPEPRRGWLYR